MADWTDKSCSVQLKRGDFCDARSVDDAPFPICECHLIQITRYALQNAASLSKEKR